MQSILEQIQCGILVLTVDLISQDSNLVKIETANYKFMQLVFGENSGKNPDNIIGLSLQECLPIELSSLLSIQIADCLQTRAVTKFEVCLNSSRFISISLSLQVDRDRNLGQIVATCEEISKPNSKDFNSQEFSNIISELSDAFVVVDRQGVVCYVNQSAEKLFGCKSEHIVGEVFGVPMVAGESTDIDVLNRGGTTIAEMRVSESVNDDQTVYVVASLRDVSERKRVEASLQLRERAIAASSNGIVITDATQAGNPMIYVNPSFERITGYSAAEVMGRDCGFLQGGDRNQIGILDLRRAIQEQRECHAVLLNYRKDGTPFWNDLYVSPVFNDYGELTNYIGVQTDITDQVKSTQRLLESEERLRTVLTSIKEGITFSDDSGYFSIFNDGMESLTGYMLSEANSSRDFTNLLYPDRQEQSKALQRLQQLQQTGQALTIETRICHKDGTFKDVLVSTKIVAYKGKRMYLSSYYDITERKKVETQLRYQSERERLLNAILFKIQRELSLDQILAITAKETQELLRIDRVVIYQFQDDWSGTFIVEAVNDASLSILGKTVRDSCFNQESIQRYQNCSISSVNDVSLADLSPCHRDLLQCFHVKANVVVAISFGGVLWGLLIAHQCFQPRHWQEFEIDLLRQLASHVAIAIQQVQLFDRVQDLNKNLERQVADRTQQLEQSLSQLERALLREKELNELKSQFIARASHEFRTPLATIQTASDLLRNYGHKMSEEKKLERIDKIQREVKGMTSLLEEVLIVGKTESGKFKLQPEVINLNEFCLEVIEQTKLIGSGKHYINFKNIDAPQTVITDPKFFKQIISNLLSNAIKYSLEGGEINFLVSLVEDCQPLILLEFQDHGIGIPIIDQEKIFEHFYRAHNVGMISGTGLGMAIIKSSVEVLGGSIQLISHEGKGTNIKVKIPVFIE
ncbi:MAG: hypothetical protein AUK48_05935 [Oscillatoriales cyanobacterium CG2_30_44_21]|nr:MAG: hypothetical protein AUK48_05935 [Oscillatoriales cyanobacterium CG2_30_44_21]